MFQNQRPTNYEKNSPAQKNNQTKKKPFPISCGHISFPIKPEHGKEKGKKCNLPECVNQLLIQS